MKWKKGNVLQSKTGATVIFTQLNKSVEFCFKGVSLGGGYQDYGKYSKTWTIDSFGKVADNIEEYYKEKLQKPKRSIGNAEKEIKRTVEGVKTQFISLAKGMVSDEFANGYEEAVEHVLDSISKHFQPSTEAKEEQKPKSGKVWNCMDTSLKELQLLALAMHQMYYKKAAPEWEPLGDMFGVISQISNMLTGLERKKESGLEVSCGVACKKEIERLKGLLDKAKQDTKAWSNAASIETQKHIESLDKLKLLEKYNENQTVISDIHADQIQGLMDNIKFLSKGFVDIRAGENRELPYQFEK